MFTHTTAIAGSFKFKPEIDALHEEFADSRVRVLEPSLGWLYVPTQIIAPTIGFRPLPDERHMSGIKAIEERFMRAVRQSDFLYLYNTEQYVGASAGLEIGCAIANEKPIFAKEPISLANVDYDLDCLEFLRDAIQVATPAEAARSIREQTPRAI